jgi:hypothetical protein
MASMRQYAADFIKFWREKCDNRLLEDKLEVIRERHKPKTFKKISALVLPLLAQLEKLNLEKVSELHLGKHFRTISGQNHRTTFGKKFQNNIRKKMSVLMLDIST